MDFNENSYTLVFYPRDFREMVPLLSAGHIREYWTPYFWGQKMGDPITQKLVDGLLQNQIHIYLTQALL